MQGSLVQQHQDAVGLGMELLVAALKISVYPTTPTRTPSSSASASVTQTWVARLDSICAMTAARELVLLHVSGALLPRWYILLVRPSVIWCAWKPMLLLLNFFALGERPGLISSTGDELMEGSGIADMGVDPFSSAPMTNWPAERFASAHADET
jgi:hypothetical protein